MHPSAFPRRKIPDRDREVREGEPVPRGHALLAPRISPPPTRKTQMRFPGRHGSWGGESHPPLEDQMRVPWGGTDHGGRISPPPSQEDQMRVAWVNPEHGGVDFTPHPRKTLSGNHKGDLIRRRTRPFLGSPGADRRADAEGQEGKRNGGPGLGHAPGPTGGNIVTSDDFTPPRREYRELMNGP